LSSHTMVVVFQVVMIYLAGQKIKLGPLNRLMLRLLHATIWNSTALSSLEVCLSIWTCMYHWLPLHPQERFLNAEIHYRSGVTSNTDAAQLAETFAVANCPTKVFLLVVLDFVHFLLSTWIQKSNLYWSFIFGIAFYIFIIN